MENWYVLYTKPRNEKKVTAQLLALGIKAYCPIIKTKHKWSDRLKKVEIPLIASCIFIKSTENNRRFVFQVPGALRFLFWLGIPAIVKNAEIEILKKWLQAEVSDAIVENLKPGDSYNIQKGHFKGKEGVVNEVTKNRLQLLLVELGMKITITRELANS
tara:strand:+ start:7384 stop:7860 length:477 start_codon:yes stop_codon:yes gene_type:complete